MRKKGGNNLWVLFSDRAIDFLLSFIRRLLFIVFQLTPRKTKLITRQPGPFYFFSLITPVGAPIRPAIFPNPLGSHCRLSLMEPGILFMHTSPWLSTCFCEQILVFFPKLGHFMVVWTWDPRSVYHCCM